MTAPLTKTRYAVGETGRLVATFAVGHQIGEHTIPIQVGVREDASSASHSTVLLLRVKIAEVVSFSSRFLYWKKGEPLEPKVVNVSILHGEQIRLKEIRVGNPAFRAELVPTDDQDRFVLRVTPPSNGERALCPLSIISERSDDPATKDEHPLVARVL